MEKELNINTISNKFSLRSKKRPSMNTILKYQKIASARERFILFLIDVVRAHSAVLKQDIKKIVPGKINTVPLSAVPLI